MNELRLPELGENIETADVSAVLVAVGDRIERDQPVIEVETEKASLEVPADCEGRVAEVRVKAGDTIGVGQVIVVVETEPSAGPAGPARTTDAAASGPAPEPEEASAPEPVADAPSRPARRRSAIGRTVPAAPSVRALARELGIEIENVPGSGPRGRISRDDVKAFAKRLIGGVGGQPAPARPGPAGPPLPDFARWGDTAREPLTGIRKATARNMATSWGTIPHVTQFDRADITTFERLRKDLNARPEAMQTKLTLTAVVLKLTAVALKHFPKFNASLDVAAGEAVYKEYVNIGVAVDTERGLLVPVVRDVNRKRLPDVATEIDDLASRARSRKLKPDEMAGASFTISNLGGLGTTYFSPIVNWPEVAILGVGRAEIRAVHREDRFEPRLILPLSLSYDHRWIDGAEAARFLRWLAEALEQPLLLLLEDGESRES